MPLFEVLDQQSTDLGELQLRRREVISLDRLPVVEVLLDGAFLMSSLVHDSERALTNLCLDAIDPAPTVLVGGLGLGYTAAEALRRADVTAVTVVERLEPVIDWHRRGLLPLGTQLVDDARCELQHADFFPLIAAPPATAWNAILVDIDHSPRARLRGSPLEFYGRAGLRRVREHLMPNGVFGLWSADPVDAEFMAELDAAFDDVRAESVPFDNPMLDRADENVIYIARS